MKAAARNEAMQLILDEQRKNQPLPPATDAAPAVCVWTETSIDPLGYAWLNSSCGLVDCHERDVLMQPDPQKHCPSCGKPVKFTEAK